MEPGNVSRSADVAQIHALSRIFTISLFRGNRCPTTASRLRRGNAGAHQSGARPPAYAFVQEGPVVAFVKVYLRSKLPWLRSS